MSTATAIDIGSQQLVPAQPGAQQATLYHSPEAERFAMEQRMAKLFVQSGLFADIKGQSEAQAIAQAYVKIALGHSMGFSPAESMDGINIIQGRPAVGAQLRAARMQRAGFSWTPTITEKGCWLAMFYQGKAIMVPRINPDTSEVIRNDHGEVVSEQLVISFTEKDATAMNLLGKDNWKKNRSDMFFARAVTRAQRRVAPGVLSGNIPSVEEAQDGDYMTIADDTAGYQSGTVIEEPRRLSETAHSGIVVTDAKPEPSKADKDREIWRGRFAELAQKNGWTDAQLAQRIANEGYADFDDILMSKMQAVYGAISAQ